MSVAEVAAAAVYLHAKAGDLAAAQKGEYGLLATNVIEYLPAVCRELSDSRTSLMQ